MSVPPIWLASYPRSGNTLLRTILNHCFGLKSASVYTKDLGGNEKLETYVGHIEHDEKGKLSFPNGVLPLIKTHQLRKNEKKLYTLFAMEERLALAFGNFTIEASLWKK